MHTIKKYYALAKPGIIYGNIITTIASFIFAVALYRHDLAPAQYPLLAFVFFATIIGLSLVIGSACVFNNYFDRGIDKKMKRTSERALVTKTIPVRSALIYGSVLGVLGFGILILCVDVLSALIALIGWISYVGIYTFAKRKSHWGAVIGSVPGAVPIVVGYTAVTNQLDLAALLLFLVLVFWQMPHFYAIALYRLDEYKEAEIPVLPAIKGSKTAKVHILLYMIGFVIATSLFFFFGYTGYTYLVIVLAFGLAWLWRAIKGFMKNALTYSTIVPSDVTATSSTTDAKWARGLFLFSLIVLLLFCVTIAIGPLLP
jgi:protoheme IX farnesyltransferase